MQYPWFDECILLFQKNGKRVQMFLLIHANIMMKVLYEMVGTGRLLSRAQVCLWTCISAVMYEYLDTSIITWEGLFLHFYVSISQHVPSWQFSPVSKKPIVSSPTVEGHIDDPEMTKGNEPRNINCGSPLVTGLAQELVLGPQGLHEDMAAFVIRKKQAS